MARVMVAGSAALDFVYQVDVLPQRAEKYAARAVDIVGGGCAANAAVGIARLGGKSQLLARFGKDEVSEIVLGDILSENVDTSACVITNGARSAMSSVYVDEAGERQIMAFRGAGLAQDPELSELSADAVLADTRWPEATRQVIELGRALGIPAVLDGEAPVPVELAAAASHVVFSEQGLMDFTGMDDVHAAYAALDLPGWCAVTLGADGVLHPGGVMPGFKVDVKDTLGAGDIWHGAFALRLGEGAGEMDAMRFAHAAAALKCTGFGGRKAAPSRAEVEQFLKERA
ncbi:PfkB family carbohydrate kinase [uncultured Litoreibacter sp.]|uniref:PfkB family carbohydrate kinase n=1 Tax=uncultured Litoreibacter sp. TaxID=1392394 RepID=UPI002636689F|nr:PfkB family carbohydrate kinase [uncultured Litoreibacter sp.]